MGLRLDAVSLATAGFFAAACQYDPYTASYTSKRPDITTLVGPWRATASSRKALAARGASALRPEILVSRDGGITMHDIPDGWRTGVTGPGPQGGSFEGRWKLEQHQDWWGLSLHDADWACSGCLMVLHDEEPHLLVLRYGDPDEGIGVEFERPSNNRLQLTKSAPWQAAKAPPSQLNRGWSQGNDATLRP